jgi:hypothetical protein
MFARNRFGVAMKHLAALIIFVGVLVGVPLAWGQQSEHMQHMEHMQQVNPGDDAAGPKTDPPNSFDFLKPYANTRWPACETICLGCRKSKKPLRVARIKSGMVGDLNRSTQHRGLAGNK